MTDNKSIVLRDMGDVERAASAMSKSGFFQDSADAAKAVVKILAGMELGFGPFASMTGIYIIQGRPSYSANIMAASVKASGKYNYRVITLSDTVCELAFFEAGQEVGRSKFTIEDAKRAQTKNLDKFPRNMLFARAMSNGVRWYCPDIFKGAPAYTPEELGADVDEAGDVIGGTFTPAPPEPVKPAPINREAQIVKELGFEDEPMTAEEAAFNDACQVENSKGEQYGKFETAKLGFMRNAIVKRMTDNPDADNSDNQRKIKAIDVIIAWRNSHQ